MIDSSIERTLDLRAGDLVEVRSPAEIRATLDERGELDALAFMPEMLPFCGKQYRVYRRADKTCDTVAKYHSRRMHDTVHLAGLRCDGSGHGGCQAGCFLFWKEAWLKRVEAGPDGSSLVQIQSSPGVGTPTRSVEDDLREELSAVTSQTDEEGVRYSCQATDLLRSTEPLEWWDVRQYAREIVRHNVPLMALLRGLWYATYAIIRRLISRMLRRWPSYPYYGGTQTKTPLLRLDLQPGEMVRVRSQKEIFATIDEYRKNRGLTYDPEMWKFSGKTFRVLRRVDHIINEKNGRMIRIPNPCIILEDVVCSGERSRNRLYCPRSIYPYWREIWLQRVEVPAE